jgi:hypothetical protein
MNAAEIYKSLILFQEIHMRKSQSFFLTRKKRVNVSGCGAKLKGRIIIAHSSYTTQETHEPQKVLLKNKERSKRKEKLQH